VTLRKRWFIITACQENNKQQKALKKVLTTKDRKGMLQEAQRMEIKIPEGLNLNNSGRNPGIQAKTASRNPEGIQQKDS